jgi:hypothetical protein
MWMGVMGSSETGRNGETSVDVPLFSFRVEFSLQCPRCDMPVPLDGPVAAAHCRSCQSDIDIPRDYWVETLGNSCGKMQDMEKGMGTGSMLMGMFHGNLTLARFDPYCDSCKTSFIDPWHLEAGDRYVCRKCGLGYPVDAPPPWLSEVVPRIRMLINALFAGSPASEAGSDVPESITCPSCAGLLNVDGSARVVRCDYCGGQVYLPDSLWLRLHGGKRKRRWFVISEFMDEDQTT